LIFKTKTKTESISRRCSISQKIIKAKEKKNTRKNPKLLEAEDGGGSPESGRMSASSGQRANYTEMQTGAHSTES